MYKRKRIVIALGGNALGNTLPEQMEAVKTTARALCDLIEEGHQVVVVHGNGPQVGMINNAMAALSREDENQPNTPLSVCVAMSQAYIGYDLQNALREELRKRGFMRTPVVTVVTQVRVDENDPAFQNPSKPIGHFMTREQAEHAEKAYGYMLIILTAVEKVAVNFGKENEKWLDEMTIEEAQKYVDEGQFAPGSMLPKVQAAMDFASSGEGRTAMITLLEKAKDGIQGKTGTKIHI